MSTTLAHAALLLIDVINDMDFPNSSELRKRALPAAERLAALRGRLKRKGVPVIYVNDNFGAWQSDFSQQIQRCMAPASQGREVAGLLLPEADDYFVLKPKHSGFYFTPLEALLGFLQVRTLILSGFAADICVLYTANDAYMRDFSLIVPSDCVAAESDASCEAALQHMKERLKARVCLSRNIR